MNNFNYKYKDIPHRVEPWFRLRKEETSWIILRAYRSNYLHSKEIRPFIYKKIVASLTNIAVPVLSFFYFSKYFTQNPAMFRYLSLGRMKSLTILATVSTWFLF